ncbi:MAG: polymer-forming cytoskeletal protein [Proteobacteria bacterium]|nr:polymer-forming cytoskeletal protein [Pseudomonadota bacterium]
MFSKNNNNTAVSRTTSNKKDAIPSVMTADMNILGNIVSDGNVDFDGTLNGNVRCNILTIRANGCVKGEVVANTVMIYGRVKGLIRAKNVQLFSTCNVEGIIMHETIAIEDGAFIDGKFKRTDKVQMDEEETDSGSTDFVFDESNTLDSKVLENIRLIR